MPVEVRGLTSRAKRYRGQGHGHWREPNRVTEGSETPYHCTQVLARLNSLSPTGVGLQVVPHQLVRVDFRRVRRQTLQLKPTVLCVDKTLHGLRPMDRMPINDKKYPCLRIDQQAPQKLKKGRCRHPTLGRHETQLTGPVPYGTLHHGAVPRHRALRERGRRRPDGKSPRQAPRHPEAPPGKRGGSIRLHQAVDGTGDLPEAGTEAN